MSDVKWTGGVEHWIQKGDIRLFMWEKKASPKVPHAGNAIVLAAQNNGRHRNIFGIEEWQFRAHVHVGTGGHGVVQRQDGVCESVHSGRIRGVRMIALENAVHEIPVNGAAVLGQKLGQLFLALRQGVAAFASPYKCVQCDFGYSLGVPFGEQGRLERAR